MEAVRGHLLLTNCLEDELTRPNIELAMKADRLLWLGACPGKAREKAPG